MTDSGIEPALVTIFYKLMQYADMISTKFSHNEIKRQDGASQPLPSKSQKNKTGWFVWEGLDESQKISVLAAITELEKNFDSHHYIDDQVIVNRIVDIIQFADKATGKKHSDMALNRTMQM